jgi:glycosyltransferase involved in cell wall biosynthesis
MNSHAASQEREHPRPRILQIFSRYREYGGEEGSVYRIGDALHRDFDIGFFLASSGDAFSGGFLQKGVSTIKAFSNWTIVDQLRHYQQLGRYDFWLIHNVFPVMSPAVYELALSLRIPVIHYLHNYRMGCVNGFFMNHGEPCQRCMHGNFLPAFQTACWHDSHVQSGIMGAITNRARRMDLFGKVHHWVAISDAQKKEHVDMGIPEDRITVIPHFYESTGAAPDYPNQGDALFVGRLSSEKGVDRLLTAWEGIQDCGRTLWIVGDGPERGSLERIVRSKRLKNVSFTGFLNQQDLVPIWEKAACSIVPSVWKEPFGMVVLESWAQQRPVIAHRIGALEEIVSHGGDGLLVPVDEPRALSEAILSLLHDPARGKAMGIAGAERLSQQYSKLRWQDVISGIFTLGRSV